MTSLANLEQKYILRRSLKIRRVFAELRFALGGDIRAIDLLRLAASLVDATTPRATKGIHRSVDLRPSFEQLPLDKAFMDGGWAIMSGELRCAGESWWDDDPSFAIENPSSRTANLAA